MQSSLEIPVPPTIIGMLAFDSAVLRRLRGPARILHSILAATEIA